MVWIPLFLDPSDGVFGRFDLAALCGCRTLNFCLFVLTQASNQPMPTSNLHESAIPGALKHNTVTKLLPATPAMSLLMHNQLAFEAKKAYTGMGTHYSSPCSSKTCRPQASLNTLMWHIKPLYMLAKMSVTSQKGSTYVHSWRNCTAGKLSRIILSSFRADRQPDTGGQLL